MYYIYCYINKINHHKYVGQTNNPKRRYYEHKSSAYNPNDKDYDDLFHKKIRQYGLDNFDYEILEEINTEDESYVDERERYWIKEKNSYIKNNCGYNMDEGGRRGSDRWVRAILTKEQVEEIYNLLRTTTLTQKEIGEKFNVSQMYISCINIGDKFYNSNFTYPIRPDNRAIDHNMIKQMILSYPDMTQQQIANLCNVSLSSIKRERAKLINQGIIQKKENK